MSKNNSEIKGGKLNHRRYSGRGPRPDMNEFKKEEAQKRMVIWQRLSPKEQLEALDQRLGKDTGAKKQRARLQALIEKKYKKQEEKLVLQNVEVEKSKQKEPRKTFDKKSQRRAKRSSDT